MAGCDDRRQGRLAQALRANLKRRKASGRDGEGAPSPTDNPSKDQPIDPPPRD